MNKGFMGSGTLDHFNGPPADLQAAIRVLHGYEPVRCAEEVAHVVKGVEPDHVRP